MDSNDHKKFGKIKEVVEKKLPPSPRGVVYMRDRIQNFLKAAGAIAIAIITNASQQFVENMPTARQTFSFSLFLLLAGAAIYFVETTGSKKRDNTQTLPPQDPPPPQPESDQNGQNNP